MLIALLVYALALTAIYGFSLVKILISFQKERQVWHRERESLMNRAMSHDWQSYVGLQQSLNLVPQQNSNAPAPRGMSDEEELKRWASYVASNPNAGEVLVENVDELGFILGNSQ